METTSFSSPCQESSPNLRLPLSASEIPHQHTSTEFDQRISNWLHRVGPGAMSAPSETHSDDQSSLGDSTYDFVGDVDYTDEESRDGNTTESIASEFGTSSEVRSEADTENSNDEDAEYERSQPASDIPVFPGLDASENTPRIGRSAAAFGDEVDRSLTQSIEFEEPDSLGDETVSVKHTVTDFNEEDTARIAERMMLRSPPKRLVATIRQTMTRQVLSIREPFRILYVGCHTARQDIIHKIGSSVAASVGSGWQVGSGSHRSSQLFNVVPITAFGSERPPEVELMQSSGYQLKVDDCVTAINMKYEDESGRPDILKLVLGDNVCYHSVPDESGFTVEPTWDLPHVAVIYCSENDTFEMRRTRTLASAFMSRHKVPSIVISHKQIFEKPFVDITRDPHAVHMCLESRDPNGPRNIIHQRLPIDLDSFKTIDARQMNRNLAYLTGLHEQLTSSSQSTPTAKTVTRNGGSDIEKTSYSLSESVSFIRNRTAAEWRALMPVGMLLLSVFLTVITTALSYRTSSGLGLSINGNLTQTEPMLVVTTTATMSTATASVSLMTSTATLTSTKTITVVEAESPVSKNLSLKPSMDLQVQSEKDNKPALKADEKKTVCTAEILGDREILIRIPSATKLSWLSKEAMSVNVTRDDSIVETERVYSTSDGIVLQFPQGEAHGVLNVSVVTSRKPKVNETFKVDFGSPWRYSLRDALRTRIQDWEKISQEGSEKFRNDLLAFGKSLFGQSAERFEEATKIASQRASESGDQMTKAAKSMSLDLAKWSAIISKEIGMQVTDARTRIAQAWNEATLVRTGHVREEIGDAVLVAQVRAKLLWLRVQGRSREYEEYEERAAKAERLRMKIKTKKIWETGRMGCGRGKESRSTKWAKKSCCQGKKGFCGI